MKKMNKYSLVIIVILFTSKFGLGQFTEPIIINSNNYGPKLILNDPNTANKVPMEFRSNDVIKWEFGLRPISNGNDLALWRFDGSYSPIIWFKYSNGNVGIGTSSPNKILDVVKNGGTLRLKNSNSNLIAPTFQIANAAGNQYLWMNYNNGDGNAHIGINTVNSGNVEILSLLHNGSAGIGTTETGTHKLAVEGTIGAREIIVEAGVWSDYVFNKDYELKNLEEVENFIEENNHLPDIPSEKEVLENGIELGKMDAKLLQKVEELTLYMIEMNKRMNSLEIENSELKKKIELLETTE
ncbi:MAG: hypothetical protein JEY96_19535 [Bacteroidales bacterium]|nr:hypothetical protein [Bacteroidales bacterium]